MPIYSSSQRVGLLNSDLYFEMFERRGRKFLKITRTKTFKELQGMEIDLRDGHLWTKEDKLHKLSMQYYGTTEFWWVIGLVNKKPTDAHYSIGDVVNIPLNPRKITGVLR